MGSENLLERELKEENLEKVWDEEFSDGALGERIRITNECGDYSEMYVIIGGDEAKAHKHKNRDEFYIVMEGQGNLKIGDEAQRVEKGDKFYISRGIVHSLERISGAPLILKAICYPKCDPFDILYPKED